MKIPETEHHGTQKVTTYYGEAEKQKKFLKQNEERVALNRKLRKEQTPIPRKVQQGMEFVAGGVVSGAKRVAGNPFVKGAINKVMERSRDIAHEMQESPAKERREHAGKRGKSYPREPYDSPMTHAPAIPHDPFGIGGFGGFMQEPRREAPASPVKRRKKRKSAARRAAPRKRSPSLMEPGYIPPSMRHLF